MEIPTELKHKPVFTAEDYDRIDGRLSGGSDAKGISLGLAQWNDRGKLDISAKVWRFSGDRWSRQSEELPLHRVIDMAIMICEAKKYMQQAYRYPKLYDEKNPEVARIGLQGDAVTLSVCTDNENIDEDIKLFSQVLSRDDEVLSERLSVLRKALEQLYEI